ncbi:unnamed protein product [Allacma fusca]|uniref:C2H2-type domain-containing protein n=1 Tax=Allacma fusca TaxID=39272 RepID=A0A8J2P8W5_9HEXA|nr:unnamed protein product [Allacma fusca]
MPIDVLILESYNKSLFDSMKFPSATTTTSSNLAKIREQVCKRYQIHIKLRHVKPLSYSTHDVACIEQGGAVDDLTEDDRTGADSYSEGLKEKVPRKLVAETGNNESLNRNEFSFTKSTEDFKYASSHCASKNKNAAMQHAGMTRSDPTGALKIIHANAHALPSGKFICNFCSKCFKHASSMYFHQRSHHKDSTKKYPCTECSKTFFKKAALDLHAVSHSKDKRHAMKIHHVSIKRDTGNSTQLESTTRLIGEGWRGSFPEDLSSCSIPREKEKTNKELTTHYLRINSKNNKVQQVAPDTFNYGESFQFKKQNEEYHCCTCGYRSAKKVNMMNHIRVGHLYTDRFVCECCGKTFRQLSELRKHQKIHVTDCNYMCEVCGSKFKTSDGLRSHKRIHVGKTGNDFECEVCKKKYQYKKTLEEHITQHKSETGKIFECPECNKRFCNKRSRNFHLNSHRKKGEKQFSCTLCKTKFSYICSLKRHLKIFHEADSQDVT